VGGWLAGWLAGWGRWVVAAMMSCRASQNCWATNVSCNIMVRVWQLGASREAS
jgi:hypothetical protein